MIAYNVEYQIAGKTYDKNIDAKNLESAMKKIARLHKVDKKEIKYIRHTIIGYF